VLVNIHIFFVYEYIEDLDAGTCTM
jgi:hypothetical protein